MSQLRPLVLSVITLAALVGLLALSLGAEGAQQRMARQQRAEPEQSCHLREIDLCVASIAVFTQSPNQGPVTNGEINRQCKLLLETEGCLKNYTQRCMTDSQSQFMYMFADGGLDLIRELCKSGSKLRSSYLKYGDCLNEQHKAQRLCMRDFQVSLERAVDIEWQSRLKLGCCAFNKLNACLRDVIEPSCGAEAYELSKQLFRATFSRLPSISCAKYEHSSKACAELLPPAGSVPKGAKSHSVLSKLLSSYSGS